MSKPTDREIIELALTNPFVFRWIKMWRDKTVTWEEALMGSILVLDARNRAQTLKLQTYEERYGKITLMEEQPDANKDKPGK